jgi:hypothetical protein
LRRLPLLTIVLIAMAAAAFAGCGGDDDNGGGSTASTPAANLTDCNISGKQQNLGASYVTSIKVAKVSCGQAEKVVAAYHACRIKNGGPGGNCDTAVLGFTCTEGPRQSVPNVQFNATADCRQGDAEINTSYTQNF